MSNLYWSGKYKDKTIQLLINNETVVRLINPVLNPALDLADNLTGGEWSINGEKITEQGYIFDYSLTDNTFSQPKTCISVETDIDTISQNMFMEFGLYIYVFTHKSLVQLSSASIPSKNDMNISGYCGNRIDCLCDAVDRMINGNPSFGIGEVMPAPNKHMTVYTPHSEYYGKCLKYIVKNYNTGGDSCGNS